jgi:glycine cleavage system H lipoate-binding protein
VSDCFAISWRNCRIQWCFRKYSSSVNADPYGAGWMIKIKVSDVADYDSLLSSDAYKELIGA